MEDKCLILATQEFGSAPWGLRCPTSLLQSTTVFQASRLKKRLLDYTQFRVWRQAKFWLTLADACPDFMGRPGATAAWQVTAQSSLIIYRLMYTYCWLQTKQRLAEEGIQWQDELTEYQPVDDYCDVSFPELLTHIRKQKRPWLIWFFSMEPALKSHAQFQPIIQCYFDMKPVTGRSLTLTGRLSSLTCLSLSNFHRCAVWR